MTTFQQLVYAAVKQIPKGKTKTYKEVAFAIGYPRAARAVGTTLKRNTNKGVPCHRVVRSDGRLGGYNGLRGKKLLLLEKEGAIKVQQ